MRIGAPGSIRRTAVALVAGLAAITFDLSEASSRSGAVALVAMLASSLWFARELRANWSMDLRSLRKLLRLEVGLVSGCLLFAACRGWILFRQLSDGEGLASLAAAARLYDLLFVAFASAGELVLWRARLLARLLQRLGRRPPLLLAASFGAMILVATLLLCMPWSVRSVADVSALDALFTATSAVCVTGLTVNDVGSTYTPFGQLVILLAIQFGGIGIMTLGAMALTLRRDASLASQSGYASLFESSSLRELRGLVRTIVSSTLLVETVGALCLWVIWSGDPLLEGHSVVWCSVFHAVSAFCNAGFALFRGNLAPFTTSAAPQIVIMVLIILGGLGFPVYRALGARVREELELRLRGRAAERTRFDLSARVVLICTAFLIALGALAFMSLEWCRTLLELDLGDKLMAGLFASVTTRTAGFNTIDFGAMAPAALLVAMALMFIGGSPSSTAGGVKTTTAAVMFASVAGELGRHEPRLGGRALGSETRRRATAVVATFSGVLGLVVFLLCLTEDQDFLALAFESVSALGTVGLSTGITPELSSAGRVVIVAAMFLGRIGPLTIALAVGGSGERERFRYPTEEIAIW